METFRHAKILSDGRLVHGDIAGCFQVYVTHGWDGELELRCDNSLHTGKIYQLILSDGRSGTFFPIAARTDAVGIQGIGPFE